MFSQCYVNLACKPNEILMDRGFWNWNSYLSRAVFLQVFAVDVGHFTVTLETSAVRSHHRGLVWRGRGLKGWGLDVKGHMCTFAMTFGILWTQTLGHKLELVTRLPKSILLHRCLSENKSNKCIKGHNPEEMGICLYQDVIKYVFTILTQRQSQEFCFVFFNISSLDKMICPHHCDPSLPGSAWLMDPGILGEESGLRLRYQD